MNTKLERDEGWYSYLDCAIIKDRKPLESSFLVQVVQLFIGSDIQFDGKVTLKNSSEPSDMESYSDSELDQDSEVEISIDNSSEVIQSLITKILMGQN